MKLLSFPNVGATVEVLCMDTWFNPTPYWACDILFMLELKLIHVSQRGPGNPARIKYTI